MRALRLVECRKGTLAVHEISLLRKRIFELEDHNKYLKENLKEKIEELQQKDMLLSVLAHDLKNTIGSIIGFSDLLIKNSYRFDNERINKYNRLINQTSRQSYGLLLNLLDWFRSIFTKSDFAKENIDIARIINQNITLYEALASLKQITIETNVPENLPVIADFNSSNAIIRNLLSNAIKFTPDNGRITISAIKLDNYVEFIFSDTGPGISKEQSILLFNNQVDALKVGTLKEKGSGLGLLLCKEFVERNGGKIWLSNENSPGAHFHFTLPIN